MSNEKKDYITKIKKQIEEINQKAKAIKNPVNEYIQIAVLYIEIDELDNAINYLNMAKVMDFKNPIIYYKLAMIYEKKKDYKKAIECWEEVIKHSSKDEIIQIAKKHIKLLTELK